MKKILFGIILALIGITIYLWFFPNVGKDKVVVTKEYLNNLAEVANKPPEIVFDTIWRDTTIYIEKETPVPIDDGEVYLDDGEVYSYADSLETEDVKIWLWDKISKQGIILNREWAYRLNGPYMITKQITQFKPLPMPYIPLNYTSNKKEYKYYAQIGYDLYQGGIVGGVGIVRNRFMLGVEAGKQQFEVKTGILF